MKIVLLISFAAFIAVAHAKCNSGEECVIKSQCSADEDKGNGNFEWSGASCGNGKICCEKEKNYKLNPAPSCGFHNKLGAGFYNEAQGNNAQFAEFQWMASIEDGSNKICTGSLIDKNIVLTTASCVEGKNKDSLNVRLGSWKTASSGAKPETEEIHKVDKIINQDKNGVALIVLKTSADVNMYINPVCLAVTSVQENEKCTVVAWGNGKAATGELKKFDVTVQKCKQSSEKAVCAELKDQVEIGASLICPIPNTEDTYQQVGIALTNPSSGQTTFVNIPDVKTWVDGKSTELAFKKESYTFSKLNSRFILFWLLGK